MSALSNVLTVEQLFAGRLFHVPDYQRGYAWETQQRAEFLDDLELLNPGREHYTGTIVLHRTNGSPQLDAEGKNYASYDVVDGQQRLTTIVLLLDSIRRSLSLSGDPTATTLADGLGRSYLAATSINGLPLYKVQLNSDCDHYFRTVAISDDPGPEGPQISSERRLADARLEFERFLDEAKVSHGEAYREWLTGLYLKIAHQLRLTLYEVESAAEVGVIFEVMNNRGKPLSELEKVKNYLLYAGSTLDVAHDLGDVVNEAWAEIFRQLMAAGLTSSADEDQLLRAHWLTCYDPQARKWGGSKAIKSRFDLRKFQDKPEELLAALVAYTESLRASCVGYCDARAPERADSFFSISAPARDAVKQWSAKLIRTNVVAPFLPLLIATRNRHAADSAKYLELVQLCEKFAFRVYRLLERRADAGQADLFRLGYELQRGRSFDETLDDLRATLVLFSSKARFEEALTRTDYNWYDWAGLKYFLYEYEEHLAARKGAVPKVAWDDVRRRERGDTIEHVYPQTPSHEYWSTRFTADDRRTLTHDLGNLALTKDNSSYGNKPFPGKKGSPGATKACYLESPFYMEREIALADDWTPQAIERRRAVLIEWARTRWHVDAAETSEDGSNADLELEAALSDEEDDYAEEF